MAKKIANNAAMFGGKSFKDLLIASTKRGDIFFALAIILMLVILIMPMPAWLLDIALAFSITISCLVLMTAIFIERPNEFNAFPLVLLITTMYRLSLNLASTRLILSKGYQGPDAAGEVIAAFGGFIMGNNFVIGVIVFAILVIVNFVVITKGSGRIAEVAARFALDAMPGKQMAIDADLSSGLITEDQARARREELSKESSFYGAMDGASKFVRGDAIAGLIITFINIVAGIIIGMVQNNMSFADAGETYTRLTVGDGLVSQVPALIISVAAGILVSKAGMTDATDKVLFEQVANYPKALGMSAFMAVALGMLPGTPALPFMLLGSLTGITAYYLDKQQKIAQQRAAEVLEQEQKQGAIAKAADEPIANALRIDLIRLEIGYGLLPLINEETNRKLTDQIKALRRALASELGFVMPSIRIQDNMQLEANEYNIYIKEVRAGKGELRPTSRLRCPAKIPPSRPSVCGPCGLTSPIGKRQCSAAIPWLIPQRLSPRILPNWLKTICPSCSLTPKLRNCLTSLTKSTKNSLKSLFRAKSASARFSEFCKICCRNVFPFAICRQFWKGFPKPWLQPTA